MGIALLGALSASALPAFGTKKGEKFPEEQAFCCMVNKFSTWPIILHPGLTYLLVRKLMRPTPEKVIDAELVVWSYSATALCVLVAALPFTEVPRMPRVV